MKKLGVLCLLALILAVVPVESTQQNAETFPCEIVCFEPGWNPEKICLGPQIGSGAVPMTCGIYRGSID